MTGAVPEAVRLAWGGQAPDWVAALALACARESQSAVARQLGRSAAAVSTVLSNSYGADPARIEERVRGLLMGGRVTCPGLGSVNTADCQDWRDKAAHFVVGSPLRARMYRACHGCPRFLGEARK